MFSCFFDSSVKLQHKQGVYKERKDVAYFSCSSLPYLSGRGLITEYFQVYAENL